MRVMLEADDGCRYLQLSALGGLQWRPNKSASENCLRHCRLLLSARRDTDINLALPPVRGLLSPPLRTDGATDATKDRFDGVNLNICDLI